MRKFGFVIIVIGAIFIAASLYIKGQVDDGKVQVEEAQENVDKGKGLFSDSRVGEDVGNILSKPIQKKIDAGQLEIEKYEAISMWLLVGGLVFCAAGVGALIIHKKR